jgi:hypothetical protein
VERRNLVGGGLLAGLTSLLATESSAAAAQRGDSDDQIAAAVSALRRALEHQFDVRLGPSRTIAKIREQQRVFIRGSQKYPDFIEVGLEVWESVYDWHVRNLQPVTMTRTSDGRYTMLFLFTTLVLRPDLDVNYVGYAYDAKG